MSEATKPRHWTRYLLASAAVSAVLGYGAGTIMPAYAKGHDATPTVIAEHAAATASGVADWSRPADLADLVETVSPAVVQITAKGHSAESVRFEGGGQLPDDLRNTPFGDLFRQFEERGGGGAVPERSLPERAAIGSGFIIDASGILVTNNHVVDGADTFSIMLKDGRSFEAKLLGVDNRTDLAVLKIETHEDLPVVLWGDSDSARVGDAIFAVGAPFGLQGSVTSGIISARGREIGSGPYDDYIQIDAPINQGNSGGPLFDRAGQVVGVNTAIYSPSGGNVGIGFAIPSGMANSIVRQIVDHGSVERGWLGVAIQPVNKEIAESLGLENAHGAMVASVEPNSPAAKAGFKPGDIIRKYDAQPVDDASDLSRLVAETAAGAKAKLEVFREGRTRTLEARIEKLQLAPEQVAENLNDEGKQHFDKLGAELVDSNGSVVVAAVDPDGAAAERGVRSGDLIKSINQQSISSAVSAEELVNVAKREGRPSVLAQIERDGVSRFIAIPLQG